MINEYAKLAIALSALLVTVLPVQAEIYKWVDKDGTVKYTDTPPPNGAKPLSTISKKAVKPVPTVDSAAKEAITPSQQVKTEKKEDLSPEAQAKRKKEIEEVDRKNKAELEAQAKKKQLNCSTARANYQTYSQGGRVYKTNEKGEREYVDEKGLAEGAAQAQRDMQEYCS